MCGKHIIVSSEHGTSCCWLIDPTVICDKVQKVVVLFKWKFLANTPVHPFHTSNTQCVINIKMIQQQQQQQQQRQQKSFHTMFSIVSLFLCVYNHTSIHICMM